MFVLGKTWPTAAHYALKSEYFTFYIHSFTELLSINLWVIAILISWLQFGEQTQWAVPQLSIMIIYTGIWSILIQWIRVIVIVWWQNKAYYPYHKNKGKLQKGEEAKVLWNYAFA